MAKKRSRAKKLTQTQQYTNRLLGIEYLADISVAVSALYEQSGLKKRKKATKKQLREAEKIYKQARQVMRAQGFTDIPDIRTITKELELKQEQTIIKEEDYISSALEEDHEEELVTIEIGVEFCNGFIQHIKDIHDDTLAKVEEENGLDQAMYWAGRCAESYYECLSKYDLIVATANGDYELIARTIKAQPDYDVILATDYLAPSSMDDFFTLCTEFFIAVLEDVERTLTK